MDLFDTTQEALGFIQKKTDLKPKFGIILGTGLGGLVEEVEKVAEIPYGSIPHFARSTVESHKGSLVLGHLEGKAVAVMAGRFHYYEGWTMQEITFPVRVMRALGIEKLIVTNASGGVNPHLQSGDIIVVKDHINLLPENPLRGANDERLGPRFPDLSEVYDAEMRRKALDFAQRNSIRAFEGVYSALQGPNLETPAEYAMLRRMGSDTTGMSSIPEVLVAIHAGMKVCMLSLVTNVAFPPSVVRRTTLEEVVAVANQTEPKLRLLVRAVLKNKTEGLV